MGKANPICITADMKSSSDVPKAKRAIARTKRTDHNSPTNRLILPAINQRSTRNCATRGGSTLP